MPLTCHCSDVTQDGALCLRCGETVGPVNTGTGTDSIRSGSTERLDSVRSAFTPSQKIGTIPKDTPYLDIVVDILAILHGKPRVDATPLVQIAVLAMELELAERLMDAGLAAKWGTVTSA